MERVSDTPQCLIGPYIDDRSLLQKIKKCLTLRLAYEDEWSSKITD
jgi:hypothetical protein